MNALLLTPTLAHVTHYLPSLAVFIVPVALLVVWRIWADHRKPRNVDQEPKHSD